MLRSRPGQAASAAADSAKLWVRGSMLARRIIVCLDVKDGRVVKGVNFVGLRDAGDPVECAARYDREGADEICFLDITASSDKRAIIADVVARTADEIFVPLTVGGGIRSVADVRAMLKAGADKVAMNTAAVNDPDLIARASMAVGAQALVVAVDAKSSETADCGYEVFTHGGRNPTGLDAVAWAKRVETLGAGEILLTSMDRDGTRVGFDLELTRLVSDAVGIPVIASGGVGTLDHFAEGLEKGGADAVLAASIFHFREHTVADAKRFLLERGVHVRPATSPSNGVQR